MLVCTINSEKTPPVIESNPTHQLSDYSYWPCAGLAGGSVIDGVWQTEAWAAASRSHRVLPLGETAIGLYRGVAPDGQVHAVDLVVTGAHDRPHWHQSRPGWQLIMVSLRPERMAAVLGLCPRDFFNQPMATLTGHPVATLFRRHLDAAWQGAGSTSLLQGLAATVAGLEQQAAPRLEVEGHVAQLLRQGGDPVRLNEVAADLGISTRTLRRRFRDKTGYGLKSYDRWLRLGRVAMAADALAAPNWAAVALEAGYYDQPHMISDFKALIGLTPTECHAERRAEAGAALPDCAA